MVLWLNLWFCYGNYGLGQVKGLNFGVNCEKCVKIAVGRGIGVKLGIR